MKTHILKTMHVNGEAIRYFYKRDRRNALGDRKFRVFIIERERIRELIIAPPCAIVIEEDIENEIRKKLNETKLKGGWKR